MTAYKLALLLLLSVTATPLVAHAAGEKADLFSNTKLRLTNQRRDAARAKLRELEAIIQNIHSLTGDDAKFKAWYESAEGQAQIKAGLKSHGLPEWMPTPAGRVRAAMIDHAEGLEKTDRPKLVKDLAALDAIAARYEKDARDRATVENDVGLKKVPELIQGLPTDAGTPGDQPPQEVRPAG